MAEPNPKNIVYVHDTRVAWKCRLAFRLFSFLIILAHYLLYLGTDGFAKFWFNTLRYLTYWTLLLNIVYFGRSLFSRTQRPDTSTVSSLNHLAVSSNILVTVFYFVFLFEAGQTFSLRVYLAIVNHSLPLALSLVDLFLNGHVYHYSNIPYFVVYQVLYLLVNFLVTTVSGEAVYKVLDFKTAATALYVVLALALFLFGVCLSIWLQAAKRCIFNKSKMSEPADDAAIKSNRTYTDIQSQNINMEQGFQKDTIQKTEENEYAINAKA